MRLQSCFRICLVWLLLASWAMAQGGKLPVSIYYSLPPAHAKVLEDFVAEYRLTHVYLDVTTKNFPQPEGLYLALVSGQDPPTFALLDPTWLETVIQKQPSFLPVETWMPKEQFLLNWAVKCNCFVPLWDSCTIQGKLMAMPFCFTTKALIVNADVMAKAGIKVLPATWDQLAKSAEKIADPKKSSGLFALALSVLGTPEQNAHTLQILVWQNGGDSLGEVAGDAVQKANQTIVSWGKFLAPLDGPATPASCVAMFVGTMEDYLNLRTQGLPVKVALLPGVDKKNRGTGVQAWAWGIFKTFPTDQMYKIQELAFFLFDFPQQLRWAEQTPYLAAHLKVFDNPFYRQIRLADHSNLRVFLNSLGGAKLVPSTDRNLAIYRSAGKNLDTLLKGEKPPTNTTAQPAAH